jgi:hypothetical protein
MVVHPAGRGRERTWIFARSVVDAVVANQPQNVRPQDWQQDGLNNVRRNQALRELGGAVPGLVTWFPSSDGRMLCFSTNTGFGASYVARPTGILIQGLPERIIREQPQVSLVELGKAMVLDGEAKANAIRPLLNLPIPTPDDEHIIWFKESGRLFGKFTKGGQAHRDYVYGNRISESLMERVIAEQPKVAATVENLRTYCNSSAAETEQLFRRLLGTSRPRSVWSQDIDGDIRLRAVGGASDFVSGSKRWPAAFRSRIVREQPYVGPDYSDLRVITGCSADEAQRKITALLEGSVAPSLYVPRWSIDDAGELRVCAPPDSGDGPARSWFYNTGVKANKDKPLMDWAVANQPRATADEIRSAGLGLGGNAMRKAFLRLLAGCELIWEVDEGDGELMVRVSPEARGPQGSSLARTRIYRSDNAELIARVIDVQPQFPAAMVTPRLYGHTTRETLKRNVLELLKHYAGPTAPTTLKWHKDFDDELLVTRRSEGEERRFYTGLYPRNNRELHTRLLADQPQTLSESQLREVEDARGRNEGPKVLAELMGAPTPAATDLVDVRWTVDSDTEIRLNGTCTRLFAGVRMQSIPQGLYDAILAEKPKLTRTQVEGWDDLTRSGADGSRRRAYILPVLEAWYANRAAKSHTVHLSGVVQVASAEKAAELTAEFQRWLAAKVS